MSRLRRARGDTARWRGHCARGGTARFNLPIALEPAVSFAGIVGSDLELLRSIFVCLRRLLWLHIWIRSVPVSIWASLDDFGVAGGASRQAECDDKSLEWESIVWCMLAISLLCRYTVAADAATFRLKMRHTRTDTSELLLHVCSEAAKLTYTQCLF